MTHIYKSWLIFCLLLFALPSSMSVANAEVAVVEAGTRRVVDIKYKGLVRTDPAWLASYIDFALPSLMSHESADFLRRKLLTTSVFTEVAVSFEPAETGDDDFILVVDVSEKWTSIPVIRAVYGGGTPLYVLGGYDIHTLGRLWTLGAEARKYGDAPPGYVVYFRDPRHAGNRFSLGAEFWQMRRQREIFDRDGTRLGSVSTRTKKARVSGLAPWPTELPVGNRFAWKYGVDVTGTKESAAHFAADFDKSAVSKPPGLMLPESDQWQLRILPMLVHDNVDIDNTQKDGLRLLMRAGPVFEAATTHSVVEVEAFYYHLLTPRLNLAGHWFLGSTTSSSFESLYFLGGFDSVRGLPDGVVYGNHATYMNWEARLLTARWKYLWVETAAFYDEGMAAQSFAQARDHRRSAVGAGLRLAVPQVHRLMFRFDYAWSIDGSGSRGLSAGLNHFFQPYRPL